MSIAIKENSIIAGDKNGSVFSIACIAMVEFVSFEFVDVWLWFLNRTPECEKRESNQMHELANKIPMGT